MESRRHYLRAESAAAAVDYAPEGLVPSVRQHVPFQPPPRTGTPPLHLATLPLAHEVVAPCLGVDVSYLKERGKITCQTNESFPFLFSFSLPFLIANTLTTYVEILYIHRIFDSHQSVVAIYRFRDERGKIKKRRKIRVLLCPENARSNNNNDDIQTGNAIQVCYSRHTDRVTAESNRVEWNRFPIYLQMFEKFAARLEALLALVPPAHTAVRCLLPVLLRLPRGESYGGRGGEYRR